MNLPHQKPLLFAKKILQKNETEVMVLCEFDFTPTFGMALEASAQASAAFGDEVKEAFLAGANNVEKLKNFDKKSFIVSIKKLFKAENLELFEFNLENYLKGKFVIYVR